MTENKDNTTFNLHKPHIYELKYLDHYGEESTFRGNSKQVINYILNQQL